MIILKIIISVLIVFCASNVGIQISKKYVFRVQELNEFKSAFNIMETKIRFTYEPLKVIFKDIADLTSNGISQMFLNASQKIDSLGAKRAWDESIESVNLNLSNEDKEIIKSFGNMLGKTDKLGQISEIELVLSLLDVQIDKANSDRNKNEKLYKKMGLILGVGMVIILL